MSENKLVSTIKTQYRENFEQIASEKVNNGYTMVFAGYNAGAAKGEGCWWAVLVKEAENKEEAE